MPLFAIRTQTTATTMLLLRYSKLTIFKAEELVCQLEKLEDRQFILAILALKLKKHTPKEKDRKP